MAFVFTCGASLTAQAQQALPPMATIAPTVADKDSSETPIPDNTQYVPGVPQATPPAISFDVIDQNQATPDPDLWARIRRGFAMPALQNTLVTNHEQWYVSRPAYIARMTERSSKYLYHIVEELERRNMPTELALLPFIESAFNPKAVSSAKAAGMWQFMPSTGRYFALKQNLLRDDRRDVLASTRAALDYLQKLHGMFGDWHLALAAYNWGEGSVARALKKNERSERPQDYVSLKMPDETSNYVPKLQAVKNIVLDPAAFQVQLPEVPNHPYFKRVPIAKDMDVVLAAKLAEMDIDDFKSLNPAANKPTMFAAATPYILLPWDSVGIYERNLAIHNGQTAGWTVWTAPKTIKVVDAARQFGMSEAQFRHINGIPPKMLIKANSTLLVPRAAHQQAEVSEHIVDNAQLNLQAEVTLVKRTIVLGKPESLTAFAKRVRQSPQNVAAWNGVGLNARFKAKQAVTIWVPQGAKTAKKSSVAGASSKSKPRSTKQASRAPTKITPKPRTSKPSARAKQIKN